MAQQQTDDELNLRRKARRRLIGAVALTLAVVVILPMVLDSAPKPSGKDIDLSIPASDKVGEFVPRVPVSEVAGTLPVTGSATSPAPLAAPAIARPAQAQPTLHKPPESQKSAVTQKSTESQKSTETRNADSPVSVEAYVAQVGAYANPDTAKQELKKLKQWGFKAYTEKAGDKMRVRVGPYPDRDKAEQAGLLLEKHGLHPVIISTK
jgi:DedD protein